MTSYTEKLNSYLREERVILTIVGMSVISTWAGVSRTFTHSDGLEWIAITGLGMLALERIKFLYDSYYVYFSHLRHIKKNYRHCISPEEFSRSCIALGEERYSDVIQSDSDLQLRDWQLDQHAHEEFVLLEKSNLLKPVDKIWFLKEFGSKKVVLLEDLTNKYIQQKYGSCSNFKDLVRQCVAIVEKTCDLTKVCNEDLEGIRRTLIKGVRGEVCLLIKYKKLDDHRFDSFTSRCKKEVDDLINRLHKKRKINPYLKCKNFSEIINKCLMMAIQNAGNSILADQFIAEQSDLLVEFGLMLPEQEGEFLQRCDKRFQVFYLIYSLLYEKTISPLFVGQTGDHYNVTSAFKAVVKQLPKNYNTHLDAFGNRGYVFCADRQDEKRAFCRLISQRIKNDSVLLEELLGCSEEELALCDYQVRGIDLSNILIRLKRKLGGLPKNPAKRDIRPIKNSYNTHKVRETDDSVPDYEMLEEKTSFDQRLEQSPVWESSQLMRTLEEHHLRQEERHDEIIDWLRVMRENMMTSKKMLRR